MFGPNRQQAPVFHFSIMPPCPSWPKLLLPEKVKSKIEECAKQNWKLGLLVCTFSFNKILPLDWLSAQGCCELEQLRHSLALSEFQEYQVLYNKIWISEKLQKNYVPRLKITFVPVLVTFVDLHHTQHTYLSWLSCAHRHLVILQLVWNKDR